MFYSHEILTSRKYGVATVWLVATLGSKSSAKKVSKKAILDVDVKKACDTIIEPQAPMALRLQSNLLYGVSRVYDQQCGFVLHDAQAAQLKLRELFKPSRHNDLDSSADVRPDQLLIGDDPAFLPDMALPAFDFDLSQLLLEPANDSQRSTQSMLSIRNRSGSISSHDGSIIGLNRLSSSSHGAYQLPLDPFGGSSLQKPSAGRPDEEEDLLYDEDVDWEIDADGMMREITAEEQEARRAVGLFPGGHGRLLGSDSAASGRVRKEHEDAATGRVLPTLDGEGDFNMNFGEDDGMVFADAEPFPLMSGGLGGNDRPNPLLAKEDKIYSEEGSSEIAEAPAKRRKPRVKKVIAIDNIIELRNTDLMSWNTNYMKNMAEARAVHDHKKELVRARTNAEAFVLRHGLNGVGQGIGALHLPSPLVMFSGASLLAAITGKTPPTPKSKKGTKRPSPVDEAEISASKRPRQDEPDHDAIMSDEMGRAFGDDDMGMAMHDSYSGVEIGRDAPDALADRHSSSMPWNVSASVNSYQRGASSSIQGARGIPGSMSKRRTSASPLVGRGSNLPGQLEAFSSQLDDDGMVMYGRSDNESEHPRRESLPRSVSSSQADHDFEIFGAAAQVDTQTAASSQWVRDALDKESNNFFEFVRNTIGEKGGDELDGDADAADILAVGGVKEFVTFEELFDPEKNTAMVAAQAFYHVLSLATKKRVWVEQEVIEMQPFGEIRVGVVD